MSDISIFFLLWAFPNYNFANLLKSVGHKGIYGHEFLEFEFRPDGRLRYANNSNYKSDVLIRKEGFLIKIFQISLYW